MIFVTIAFGNWGFFFFFLPLLYSLVEVSELGSPEAGVSLLARVSLARAVSKLRTEIYRNCNLRTSEEGHEVFSLLLLTFILVSSLLTLHRGHHFHYLISAFVCASFVFFFLVVYVVINVVWEGIALLLDWVVYSKNIESCHVFDNVLMFARAM